MQQTQSSFAVHTQEKAERTATKNTGFSIHFVIKGAQKRRTLAYARAKSLQRELGVIPTLVCVK